MREAASLVMTAADASERVDADARESVTLVLSQVLTRLEEAGEVELSVLVGSRIASLRRRGGARRRRLPGGRAVGSSRGGFRAPPAAVIIEGDGTAALDEAMEAMGKALSAAVEGAGASASEGADDPLSAIARAFENALSGGVREEGRVLSRPLRARWRNRA